MGKYIVSNSKSSNSAENRFFCNNYYKNTTNVNESDSYSESIEINCEKINNKSYINSFNAYSFINHFNKEA